MHSVRDRVIRLWRVFLLASTPRNFKLEPLLSFRWWQSEIAKKGLSERVNICSKFCAHIESDLLQYRLASWSYYHKAQFKCRRRIYSVVRRFELSSKHRNCYKNSKYCRSKINFAKTNSWKAYWDIRLTSNDLSTFVSASNPLCSHGDIN